MKNRSKHGWLTYKQEQRSKPQWTRSLKTYRIQNQQCPLESLMFIVIVMLHRFFVYYFSKLYYKISFKHAEFLGKWWKMFHCNIWAVQIYLPKGSMKVLLLFDLKVREKEASRIYWVILWSKNQKIMIIVKKTELGDQIGFVRKKEVLVPWLLT